MGEDSWTQDLQNIAQNRQPSRAEVVHQFFEGRKIEDPCQVLVRELIVWAGASLTRFGNKVNKLDILRDCEAILHLLHFDEDPRKAFEAFFCRLDAGTKQDGVFRFFSPLLQAIVDGKEPDRAAALARLGHSMESRVLVAMQRLNGQPATGYCPKYKRDLGKLKFFVDYVSQCRNRVQAPTGKMAKRMARYSKNFQKPSALDAVAALIKANILPKANSRGRPH